MKINVYFIISEIRHIFYVYAKDSYLKVIWHGVLKFSFGPEKKTLNPGFKFAPVSFIYATGPRSYPRWRWQSRRRRC